jgi:O-antigen/teichoic acid export membrane protein
LTVARPTVSKLAATLRVMGGYTLKSAPGELVLVLTGYFSQLVLMPVVPPAALGLYVVAFSFSRIVLVLQPMIDSVVFSTMSHRHGAEMKELHDRAFRYVLWLCAAALPAALLLDREVIVAFYGPDFAEATGPFRLLVIEAMLVVLASVTLRFLLASGRPVVVSACHSAGLIATFAAAAAFVPARGVEGAALALLAGAALKLPLALGALLWSGERLPRLWLGLDDLIFVRARFSDRL